jgi:predicted Fe-Mo cluster-binding NifX family protein/predicted RNA-binding Zn-ribbon protein involved in translation (DUF1610 family)
MKKTTEKEKNTGAAGLLKEAGAKCSRMNLNSFFIYGAIVLAVGVGFYALLSPVARNAHITDRNGPKIVVASTGPSLRADVAPTLASARYFMLINPLSRKVLEVTKNPFAGVPMHGADVAYFVAGKGEEAVIAGDIGPQCYQVLAQYGIRAYGGYTGSVRDVIDLYQQGRDTAGPVVVPVQDLARAQSLVTPVGFTTPFFICPRCKWRVHVGMTLDQKIACPNCGFMGTPADGFIRVAFPQEGLIPEAPPTDGAFPNPVSEIPMTGGGLPMAPPTNVAYQMPVYGGMGYGNNPACPVVQYPVAANGGPAQPAAWGNNYGAATPGRQRTNNSPYVWR